MMKLATILVVLSIAASIEGYGDPGDSLTSFSFTFFMVKGTKFGWSMLTKYKKKIPEFKHFSCFPCLKEFHALQVTYKMEAEFQTRFQYIDVLKGPKIFISLFLVIF